MTTFVCLLYPNRGFLNRIDLVNLIGPIFGIINKRQSYSLVVHALGLHSRGPVPPRSQVEGQIGSQPLRGVFLQS